ncbi:MAG: glycosyltransferase, partial [Candidatus Mariimomonas ferrooxydans]
WELARNIHDRDPRWKIIRLARNFGQQTAISAGIYYAMGKSVIIIDADLQDPPEELHRFIKKWREGYNVVYGIRTKRKESLLKRVLYKLFYRVLNSIANIDIPLDSGDFCLIDRKIVDLLKSMPEQNRFVRGLRAWVGFRQIGIQYERRERNAGEVQYTLLKLVKLAFDGIFSFSAVPLRMMTCLGLVVSLIALIGAIFTFFQRIFSDWFSQIGLGPAPGFTTIVISILFLGGVQLICLGILGEYLGRIYDEVKRRPLWTIRDVLGFEERSQNIRG